MVRRDDLKAAALKALRDKRWDIAEENYEMLLKDWEPGDEGLADDAANYGAILRKAGKEHMALEHYKQWLARCPASISLRSNAINCSMGVGDKELARRWIVEGLRLHPREYLYEKALARLLVSEGEYGKALEMLHGLLETNSGDESTYLELCVVYHKLGSLMDAERTARKAVALSPSSADAVANLIVLLTESGKLEEAEAVMAGLGEEVLKEDQVIRAKADLLLKKQLFDEAEVLFRYLCKEKPLEPSNWLNRGAALKKLKRSVEAASILKEGLKLNPENKLLGESLGNILPEIGQAEIGIKLLRSSISIERSMNFESMTGVQFIGAGYGLVSSAERMQLARRWEQRYQESAVVNMYMDRIRQETTGRILRVGYLSADMNGHPVGRFLLPILSSHRKGVVETYVISSTPVEDEVTDELKAAADNWIDICNIDDVDAARLIADLELDVLIELGGYTGGSRLAVLAMKPCRIQMSYLGFPGPTFLDSVKWWIGDSVLFQNLEKEEQEVHSLVMVSGGYMAYRERVGARISSRNDRRFSFGSFNHSRKLSEQTLDSYGEIMRRSAGCRLVIKSVSFVEEAEKKRVLNELHKRDVKLDDVTILDWKKDRKQHLEAYNEIDVVLDPFPYSGATSTCEALWMGVPVITTSGLGMASRLSCSILASSGNDQWIAASTKDYIAIAERLRVAGVRTKAERELLRKQISESPLCDSGRVTNELERIYLEIVSLVDS